MSRLERDGKITIILKREDLKLSLRVISMVDD